MGATTWYVRARRALARSIAGATLLASLLPAGAAAEAPQSVGSAPEAAPAAAPSAASAAGAAAAPDAARAFLATSGTRFTLNGAPFQFVGANMYNAAGDPAIYQCGPWMGNPDVELDDWFRRARNEFGGQVIRFWAYQSYTKGGTDWRALDRVFRLATKHGLKVIPVLENQWVECSEGGYKHDSWYAGGYEQPYGSYPLSYREYVRRVVTRYAGEPAIAAWMLMNEAESKSAAGHANPDALYRFAADMSAFVKGLDSNHLVTLGVIGSGQPGVSGHHFERLHSIPTIDFAEYHDYHANDEAIPGSTAGGTSRAQFALYTQDAQWGWKNGSYVRPRTGTWETLSFTVPVGATAFKRIGLNVIDSTSGRIYIDHVQIGSRIYDFEDGSLQGWQVGDGASSSAAATVEGVAYTGKRALRLTVDQAGGATQVWVPATASDVPGTEITVRVYVEAPSTAAPARDTLASAMRAASGLNKPILVGEAGMSVVTCSTVHDPQLETPQSRAQKFDAKLAAFFQNGGAGYLVWTWNPSKPCDHDFSSGDPLNEVMARHAVALQASAVTMGAPDRSN